MEIADVTKTDEQYDSYGWCTEFRGNVNLFKNMPIIFDVCDVIVTHR